MIPPCLSLALDPQYPILLRANAARLVHQVIRSMSPAEATAALGDESGLMFLKHGWLVLGGPHAVRRLLAGEWENLQYLFDLMPEKTLLFVSRLDLYNDFGKSEYDAFNLTNVLVFADDLNLKKKIDVAAHEPVHSFYGPGLKSPPEALVNAMKKFPGELGRFNMQISPGSDQDPIQAIGDAMNRWVNNSMLPLALQGADQSPVIVSLVIEVANSIFLWTDERGNRFLRLYKDDRLFTGNRSVDVPVASSHPLSYAEIEAAWRSLYPTGTSQPRAREVSLAQKILKLLLAPTIHREWLFPNLNYPPLDLVRPLRTEIVAALDQMDREAPARFHGRTEQMTFDIVENFLPWKDLREDWQRDWTAFWKGRGGSVGSEAEKAFFQCLKLVPSELPASQEYLRPGINWIRTRLRQSGRFPELLPWLESQPHRIPAILGRSA
jgi:hypothetical protein